MTRCFGRRVLGTIIGVKVLDAGWHSCAFAAAKDAEAAIEYRLAHMPGSSHDLSFQPNGAQRLAASCLNSRAPVGGNLFLFRPTDPPLFALKS